MGKYKYFDQIIKQDDYLSVVGLFNRELDLLCSDMIKALVKGINDWEKEYIFKRDFEEYAKFYSNPKNANKEYVPNMVRQYNDYKTIYNGFDSIVNSITPLNQSDPKDFSMNLINAINSGGYKANFDIESVDFAGKIKIIQIRLFGDENNIVITKDSRSPSNKIFNDFLISLSSLRNETDGHASVLDRETVSYRDVKDKLYEIYNMLPAVIKDLGNVFKNPNEIKKVLQDFKEYRIDRFIEEYELANCPELVNISKTNPVDVEEIFSYNIFIEYSAMISHYNQVLTQRLFEKIKAGNKKIYYDKKSIERLKETVYSKNAALSERARNFQHELNSMRNNVEWLETEEQAVGEYPTDYIVSMLPRMKGHWCFITADRHFASEIWAAGNDKLVAFAPNDDRKTFIALDKDTVLENKNIEYILDEKDIDNDVIIVNKEPETPNTAGLQEELGTSEKPSDSAELQTDIIREENTEEAQEASAVIETPKPELVYEAAQDQKNEPVNEIIPETEIKPLIPVTGGKVLLANQVPMQLDRETGSGGEGNIYDVGYGNKYVKIYKEESWSGKKLEKVAEMVKDKALFEDSPQICWPMDTVYNISGQPVGFMMPAAGTNSGSRDTCSLESLLTDIRAYEKPEWERTHLVDICRQVATLFRKLHSQDIYMGDVNPSNIFINYSKGPLDIRAYFIDVDSYQYKEYTCPVGLKEFTSPRILREHGGDSYSMIKRTGEDESFAVAVLYYYILFLSEYPFKIDFKTDIKKSIQDHLFLHAQTENKDCGNDSCIIWNNLTGRLRKMFSNVFVEEKYIADSDWIEAFQEYLAAITDEKSSNQIFPEDYLKSDEDSFVIKTCSFCGETYQVAESAETKGVSLCGDCRKIQLFHKRKIYRMECPKCGKYWTANEWDLLENISDGTTVDNIDNIDFETKIACPDCEDTFKISNMSVENAETVRGDRKERLRELFKTAMNNYNSHGGI